MFHILEYRYGERSLTTSLAIHTDGHQVKQLTERAVSESDIIRTLTRDMHDDSRFIKILTFLAFLYTPASLAAVSWPLFK